VSATGALRTEGFPYCYENGAWTAHQQGREFDAAKFRKGLHKLGADADFTVVPDIVGAGLESLAFSLSWLDEVLASSPRALLPVQDGVDLADVEPHLSDRVGIFVGGNPRTNWKERTLPMWAKACRDIGTWCHVGRVNTQRRIHLCAAAGATSFDGTSATRWAKSLPILQRAVAQTSFVLDTRSGR